MVRVTVNEKPRELPVDSSVEDLLSELRLLRPGIAVAINLEVVPRSEWSATRFQDGDRVDVVEAVGGG